MNGEEENKVNEVEQPNTEQDENITNDVNDNQQETYEQETQENTSDISQESTSLTNELNTSFLANKSSDVTIVDNSRSSNDTTIINNGSVIENEEQNNTDNLTTDDAFENTEQEHTQAISEYDTLNQQFNEDIEQTQIDINDSISLETEETDSSEQTKEEPLDINIDSNTEDEIQVDNSITEDSSIVNVSDSEDINEDKEISSENNEEEQTTLADILESANNEIKEFVDELFNVESTDNNQSQFFIVASDGDISSTSEQAITETNVDDIIVIATSENELYQTLNEDNKEEQTVTNDQLTDSSNSTEQTSFNDIIEQNISTEEVKEPSDNIIQLDELTNTSEDNVSAILQEPAYDAGVVLLAEQLNNIDDNVVNDTTEDNINNTSIESTSEDQQTEEEQPIDINIAFIDEKIQDYYNDLVSDINNDNFNENTLLCLTNIVENFNSKQNFLNDEYISTNRIEYLNNLNTIRNNMYELVANISTINDHIKSEDIVAVILPNNYKSALTLLNNVTSRNSLATIDLFNNIIDYIDYSRNKEELTHKVECIHKELLNTLEETAFFISETDESISKEDTVKALDKVKELTASLLTNNNLKNDAIKKFKESLLVIVKTQIEVELDYLDSLTK